MNSSQRGAFVDNKGVRWDTNDSDFEGFLGKQSRWVRGTIILCFSHRMFYEFVHRMEKTLLCLKGFKIVLHEGDEMLFFQICLFIYIIFFVFIWYYVESSNGTPWHD